VGSNLNRLESDEDCAILMALEKSMETIEEERFESEQLWRARAAKLQRLRILKALRKLKLTLCMSFFQC
jgi:hypothetical protein